MESRPSRSRRGGGWSMRCPTTTTTTGLTPWMTPKEWRPRRMDDKPDTARAQGLEALVVGLRLKRPGSVVRIIDEKPKISLREIIERVRLRCYCWSCGKETQRHNEHDTPECLDC